MKRFLKKTSVLLCATLLVTSLTACGKSKSEETSKNDDSEKQQELQINFGKLPLVNEPETIKIATIIRDGEPASKDIKFWQHTEEATNVKVSWVDTTESAWTDKKNIVLTSSDQPDMYIGNQILTDTDIISLGSSGKIIPLEDLITPEIMPNLYKYLQEKPEVKEILTTPDGHIYSFPTVSEVKYFFGNSSFINSNYINNLDLPFEFDPEKSMTIEEFEQLLIAIRDQDANGNGDATDEIPWSPNGCKGDLFAYAASFGLYGGYKGAPLYVKNNEIVPSATQEEFKNFANWLNSLWVQGLIDPETFTADGSSIKAKFNNPDQIVGVTSTWRQGTMPYTPILPLTVDGKCYWPYNAGSDVFKVTGAITSAAKDPKLCAAWIDNLYTEDNSIQTNTSLALGEHIKKDANGNYEQIRPLDWNKEGERSFTPGALSIVSWVSKELDAKVLTKTPVKEQKIPVENKYLEYGCRETDGTYYLNRSRIWLTAEEAKTAYSIEAEIEPFVSGQFATWVSTDGCDDKEWDTFIKTLEGMRVNEMAEIYNSHFSK